MRSGPFADYLGSLLFASQRRGQRKRDIQSFENLNAVGNRCDDVRDPISHDEQFGREAPAIRNVLLAEC